MCCPKRSVLNIGFRALAEDEASPDFAFEEGRCAREKRSEVARGMIDFA